MSMKFSIITATYNSAASVADSINSVLIQTYKNYELIFIDGASIDNTVEVIGKAVESIKSKVQIISEPDKGIYDALNKGIINSSGDIIAFLHADDIYASNTVLKSVAAKFDESLIDSVYGDLEYVSKENAEKTIRFWRSGTFAHSKLKRGWMPPHPSFFVKKSVYDQFGLFDLSFKIAADYDFMMRVLFKEKISTTYLPEVLVKMRVGGESNKSVSNIVRKSKEDLKAMRKNGLGGVPALLSKNIRKVPQFFTRKS